MRAGILVLVLSLSLAGDVIVLKDGTRYSGRLVDKGDAWEVTTKHGSLLVKKSEVDQILTDPRDASAKVDALRAEGQRLYEEACTKVDADERNHLLGQAIERFEEAKKIYTDLRLDFPADQYAWLDDEILEIGQAIKLARDKKVLGNPQPKSAEEEYRRRRDALRADDAEGHFLLGEWCEKKGMAANARAEYEAAVKANPDHARAREKLGFVFHEGRWVTREELDRLLAQKQPESPKQAAPPAVRDAKACIADLKSTDPSVRQAAVVGLRAKPDMAVKPLVDLLKIEVDDAVRKAAVETLVEANGSAVVNAAKDALRDPSLATRFQIDILDVCDRSAEKEEIEFAAKICLYGTQADAQKKAKDVLMKHRKLAVSSVARALGVKTPDMRLRAVKVLEEMRTKDAVRALIAIGCRQGDFDNDTQRVHQECRDALQRIGKPAVPFLIEVLGNGNLKKWGAGVLFYITGQPIGSDHPAEWKKWWMNNRTPEDDLPDE